MSTPTPAASQPAPQAQTSDAKTSDNRSGADARNVLLKGFIERQKSADTPAAAPVAETTTPAETPAITETPAAVAEQVTPEAPPAEPGEPVIPETPEDLPAEPEGEDDVLSHLSSLEPQTRELVERLLADQKKHTHEAVQKRIDKERAMRGDLEREIQALKANAGKPEVVHVPAPTDANPLADVSDVQTLTTRHKEAKEAKRWAESLLDSESWPQVDFGNGKAVDAVKVGDQYLSRQDVRGILRKAEVALEDHIPARLTFLQKQQQVRQAAIAEFPFLQDKNSVEYQQAQKARVDFPWLNHVPEADWFIGAAILGQQTLDARKKAAQAAQPANGLKLQPKAPPSSQTAVPATASAPRLTGDKQAARNLAADKEKLGAKGNVSGSEVRNYFLKRETLNRT